MDIPSLIARCLVGVFLLALSAIVQAMPPKHITAEEKALLPPYCKYTQGGHVGHENPQIPSPGALRWVRMFGGTGMTAHFWRMHHYCYAIIHMMRGRRGGLTPMEYKGAWLSVIDEIDYVLQFVSDDFVLLPEMLLNRGRALTRLRKQDVALENFEKAIKIKPDYWPPYLELAEIYIAKQDKSKGIEILQEGLLHAPDAKALISRMNELGRGVSKKNMDKEASTSQNTE